MLQYSMEVAGNCADTHIPAAELRRQLADELDAIVAGHYSELKRSLLDWAASREELLAGRPSPDVPAAGEGVHVRPARHPTFEDKPMQFAERLTGERGQESTASSANQRATSAWFRRSSDGDDSLRGRRGHRGSQDTECSQPIVWNSTYSTYKKETKQRAFIRSTTKERNQPHSVFSAEFAGSPHLSFRARARIWLQNVLQLTASNYFFSCVILLYVTSMGLEVEYEHSDVPRQIQLGCNVVFMLELIMRLAAFGTGLCRGKDGFWNVLDCSLVFFSVVEMVLGSVASTASNDTLDNVMILRIVRIVRVVRVIRVMRLMRFFRPLRMLVRSIFGTLKALACAVVLLFAIMYAFAVVFTQAVADTGPGPRPPQLDHYFGSLMRSILTLFECVTNGVSWELVFGPLCDVHWFYGGLFVLYIIFATFAVLNVMTGQFCQAAIESAQRDEDEVICEQLANRNIYVQKLKQLFQNISGDDEEPLTLENFEHNMRDERVKAYFHSLDLKVADAWTLFRMLDEGDNDCIDMDEFIDGCLQLRGPASAIDVKEIANQLHWLAHHVDRSIGHITGRPCTRYSVM